MKLSLKDERFTEAKNDASAVLGADSSLKPLEYRCDDTTAYFTVGEHRKGVPAEIPVKIDGDDLVFFPERSAAQKRLLKSIGIEV